MRTSVSLAWYAWSSHAVFTIGCQRYLSLSAVVLAEELAGNAAAASFVAASGEEILFLKRTRSTAGQSLRSLC